MHFGGESAGEKICVERVKVVCTVVCTAVYTLVFELGFHGLECMDGEEQGNKYKNLW